jgi:hypothetical protein
MRKQDFGIIDIEIFQIKHESIANKASFIIFIGWKSGLITQKIEEKNFSISLYLGIKGIFIRVIVYDAIQWYSFNREGKFLCWWICMV